MLVNGKHQYEQTACQVSADMSTEDIKQHKRRHDTDLQWETERNYGARRRKEF